MVEMPAAAATVASVPNPAKATTAVMVNPPVNQAQ